MFTSMGRVFSYNRSRCLPDVMTTVWFVFFQGAPVLIKHSIEVVLTSGMVPASIAVSPFDGASPTTASRTRMYS